PTAVFGIFQTPGSNGPAVAAQVKTTLAELKQRFPNDLDYSIAVDTTLPVVEGIREILTTLAIALVLVLVVVYLFLQNWRATLIPLIAVPVSLVGTFAIFPTLQQALRCSNRCSRPVARDPRWNWPRYGATKSCSPISRPSCSRCVTCPTP